MATPKYNKFKAFNTGIANAVKYALGPNQPDQGSNFRSMYTQAANAFVGVTDGEAFEGFVGPAVNPMVQALTLYQASPNDPRVFDELKKAVNQLNAPRDYYGSKHVPQAEIEEILTSEEKQAFNEAFGRSTDDAKANVRLSTLLAKL